MEFSSWKNNSELNKSLNDKYNHKVYFFDNDTADIDESELISRIPPKASEPFIPIESFNHSLFNSVSENSSNVYNNSPIKYKNTTEDNMNNNNTVNNNDNNNNNNNNNFNNDINTSGISPPKNATGNKKSVIFKDEIDEIITNDDSYYSLTLERNFNKNFPGNSKFESILQSSPPSQFNNINNSYDPSPINININVNDNEKPIQLNGNPRPNGVRRGSILKTSINYHEKINYNNNNNNDNNNDNQIDNSFNNTKEGDNNTENENKKENNFNNESLNDDTTYNSSLSDIPIETLKDFNPDESEIINDLPNTSTDLINNMKFKHDNTQSPFLSFNSLSWNDGNSILSSINNSRLHGNHDDNYKPSVSTPLANNNQIEVTNSDNKTTEYPVTPNNKIEYQIPTSFETPKNFKTPINDYTNTNSNDQNLRKNIGPNNNSTNTNNNGIKNKNENNDNMVKRNKRKLQYENYLDLSEDEIPNFYYQNIKNYQDVNGPYVQNNSYSSNSNEATPVKNIRYPKMGDDNSSDKKYYEFVGYRTPNGFAIHKGLQLATKHSSYYNKSPTYYTKDKYWRRIEMKSKKFYDIRKKQRESRFKRIISKKLSNSLPMKEFKNFTDFNDNKDINELNNFNSNKNSIEIKDYAKIINNFENLSLKHHQKIKDDEDILIVDPRMIEKLDNKSKIIPIQNELEKREINRINHNPLDVKSLPTSYVFKSLNKNNSVQNQKKPSNKKVKSKGNISLIPKSTSLRSLSLPNLTDKISSDYSLDNPLKQNPPPHPHSPPPKPPSLLHEKFDQLSFNQEENNNQENDYSHNNDSNSNNNIHNDDEINDIEDEDDLDFDIDSSNSNSSSNIYNEKENNDFMGPVNVNMAETFKKSISEPLIKSKKGNGNGVHLSRPTLNSSNNYIKNNWQEIKGNNIHFKNLEKQIKEGMGDKPSGRETFIDKIIKDNTKKREYYYKNYLTEAFGEDRKHLVQNHLDQFKQKLERDDDSQNDKKNKFSVNGINININKYGDVNTVQTKKAIKSISNRVANRVTNVQSTENQYKNLISLQNPLDEIINNKNKSKKIIPGTSYIPRAKKVVNKNWLASLEIKPPTVEEVNDLEEFKEVEIITESSLKLRDNPLEKPYFTDYVTSDGHVYLKENNPDHPIPSYSSLILNLMNVKQFLNLQLPKPLDISEIVTYSESISELIEKSYNNCKVKQNNTNLEASTINSHSS